MVRIKIISNPYKKKTVFQNWDEGAQEWRTVDKEHDGDSKLLCSELSVGFFPLKAKQILPQFLVVDAHASLAPSGVRGVV